MTTQVERDAFAFAEAIRQQSSRIASMATAGRNKEAALAALELCGQAAQQKRRLLGEPEPVETATDDPDDADYDLSELNRLTQPPDAG
ncbi:MAG TPA: hypothetical protein VKU00_12725 [Chthonomonadaceae bacterium]|nr:hypothetical protein [Chthonomonadaceae bacterium]